MPWRLVQPHRHALEFRRGRRIEPHHKRIVPWHDVLWARRNGAEPVVTLEGVANMECRRERPSAFHVLVKVRHVRRQNQPTSPRMDADKLQAGGMSAREMQTQPRG